MLAPKIFRLFQDLQCRSHRPQNKSPATGAGLSCLTQVRDPLSSGYDVQMVVHQEKNIVRVETGSTLAVSVRSLLSSVVEVRLKLFWRARDPHSSGYDNRRGLFPKKDRKSVV